MKRLVYNPLVWGMRLRDLLNILLLPGAGGRGNGGGCMKAALCPGTGGCPPFLPPMACFSVQPIRSDMALLVGVHESKFIYHLIRILSSCVWELRVAVAYNVVWIVGYAPYSHTAQRYVSN